MFASSPISYLYWRGWGAKFANVCQPQQFLGTYLHNYQGNPFLPKLPGNTTGGQRSGGTRGCGCFTKVTPGCGCRPLHTRLLFPLTQSCGCEGTQRCGCPPTRRCSCTHTLRWNNNTMFTLDAMHDLLELLQDGKLQIYMKLDEIGLLSFFQNIYYVSIYII